MLTVTMHHTGELFLESAENIYSLNKWLHITTSKNQSQHDCPLISLEEALLDEIGVYVGVYLDDNFQSLYSPSGVDFIKNVIHKEVVNSIIGSIRDGITNKLQGRGVIGFDISDLPFLETA